QDVGHEVSAEVPTFDGQHPGRQRRQHGAALGQIIAGPQLAGVVAVDDEILDDVRLVALEGGPFGKRGRMQGNLAVNGQFAVTRPGGFAAAAWRGRGGWRGELQDAGADLGSWLLSLESGDLVA